MLDKSKRYFISHIDLVATVGIGRVYGSLKRNCVSSEGLHRVVFCSWPQFGWFFARLVGWHEGSWPCCKLTCYYGNSSGHIHSKTSSMPFLRRDTIVDTISCTGSSIKEDRFPPSLNQLLTTTSQWLKHRNRFTQNYTTCSLFSEWVLVTLCDALFWSLLILISWVYLMS